ncbi:MAG: sigma-54-dependent Fis family transcriptional regulator [Desulfobacteraceae bacterium]|nr:sigma-54-dependent Fis family transcriptional regulator [Desulfobacteraceae bacterium]MBC2756150.1 sigma-54-dependent Fis family transcriptional regulator [Desulfobacteraceae bacterium]
MAGRILIVDDEKDMLTLLTRIISEETDHHVTADGDPLNALNRFKNEPFDLVITDLKMPKMGGMALLKEMKKIRPEISVVVITAYATIETAVEAVKLGAYDYITKPFKRERILLTIDKVLSWQKMLAENITLRKVLAEKEGVPPMIGATPRIKKLFEKIKQVAPTTATVLITGESGTGKELVAKALHHNSRKKNEKMITVNCTAITENVIESELFGHVKGAFTGAWKDKKGLVEIADGGTLFLDEIGDLSLSMQTKLLRLIQEGEFKPVGSTFTKKADIRFIAATNHCLEEDIKEKRFREDLFYRLNVIRIEIPSLNERKEDIPLLARFFLKKYALLNQKDIFDFTPDAISALLSQDFPGNIRELENLIERSVIFSNGERLGQRDLFPDNTPSNIPDIICPEFSREIMDLPFREAKEKMIQLFHVQYIQSVLENSGGNISRAAEQAGIQRQYLHRLMKEVKINAEAYKSKPEKSTF